MESDSPTSKTSTLDEDVQFVSSTYPINVLQAMEDYYKLKAAYTIRLDNSKDTIKKNKSYTIQQKKEKLRNLAPNCIICNKPVGTVFLNQNRKLIAKCGATTLTSSNYEPCDLNIEIYKGNVETKDILYEEQKFNKNITTLSIIKLKLDLIFKYLSEEETLDKFDQLISEYEIESEWVGTFAEELTKMNNKFNNTTSIKTIVDENKEHFIFIREADKAYNESNDPIILKDIAEKYINSIIPNLEKLRNLQYDYCEMETEDDIEFRLVKVENSISSMEHINDEPVVHFNVQ
tara:strand:- start:3172 stop:4041 length:870 start_codon:yes stop_codon:yes gene_type:complete